jgi:hypothetical protein
MSILSIFPVENINNTPMLNMTGHNNYYVGQQIIYVYGQQQFKRLFMDNILEKTSGKDYLISSGIGAHKLHEHRLNWNNARKACINEGGERK